MKLSLPLLVTTLGLSLSIFPSTAAEDFDVQKAAKEIDKLILAGLEKHGVEPNEAIDDETFVRRVYLDVIGRIPTIEEAENFHGSNYERKREQLITDLLESEGHMSRTFCGSTVAWVATATRWKPLTSFG